MNFFVSLWDFVFLWCESRIPSISTSFDGMTIALQSCHLKFIRVSSLSAILGSSIEGIPWLTHAVSTNEGVVAGPIVLIATFHVTRWCRTERPGRECERGAGTLPGCETPAEAGCGRAQSPEETQDEQERVHSVGAGDSGSPHRLQQ